MKIDTDYMKTLNRNDIDHYLYLIAKEYKKQNRSNPECEIILVGGGSILLNYNFRTETTDIDSIIRASSNFKDIINKIGDEYNLPNNWINTDFIKTKSYTPKLIEHSKFYKKFYGCLSVRTISAEYLISMKLKSFRKYKHDLSDIIGIMKEQYELESPINYNMIEEAFKNLYDEELSEQHKQFLQDIYKTENLEDLFYETIEKENKNKQILLKAEEDYKDVITEENIDSFLKHFPDD